MNEEIKVMLAHDPEIGPIRQLALFKFNEVEAKSDGVLQSSSFIDPAFATNKSLPVHRWIPWIAGFSSDFVRDALKRYLKEGSPINNRYSRPLRNS